MLEVAATAVSRAVGLDAEVQSTWAWKQRAISRGLPAKDSFACWELRHMRAVVRLTRADWELPGPGRNL